MDLIGLLIIAAIVVVVLGVIGDLIDPDDRRIHAILDEEWYDNERPE